jgi:hypothetical protein
MKSDRVGQEDEAYIIEVEGTQDLLRNWFVGSELYRRGKPTITMSTVYSLTQWTQIDASVDEPETMIIEVASGMVKGSSRATG